MPSTTLSELDTLFHQLQRRMVESGEWDRILLQLRYQLNDAGWLDSMRAQTLEHGNGLEQPSFRELLDGTRMRAHDVPEAVKFQVLTSIRSFLDKQIE
ncbi:hypothetical protein B0F90DRAFT_1817845 [Multifurca ochricompacta]|uniref:Transcription and mRNA export factor SUS1 n=1 Tax=Multifurca ochricompacta TaxID=376703 RepID=A0AAD4M531_9AGAM|nr:hypothetical protein B0F90DRAFT_1817845 [Multifurca ochricompacta]